MQPVALSPTTAVPDAAAWAPAAVDAPADAALHTATLQAAARPQALQAPEAPRPVEAAMPMADTAQGFTLPADQLLPVTLIGLQVQAGDAWPLSAQARDARWPRRDGDGPGDESDDGSDGGSGDPASDENTRRGRRHQRMARPPADDEASAVQEPAADAGDGAPLVADTPADWFDPLARAIDERLAAAQPPAALLAAAEQWSRGRCVLLVCPQTEAAEPMLKPGAAVVSRAGAFVAPAAASVEPAWAFVLWPRRGARPRGPLAMRFGFTGQRVEARLQWPPQGPRSWCSVRAVKQQLAHSGRQLVALDAGAAPGGPVPCEVQLGPVRAAAPRWRLASVRIDAVRRLWSTLGGQWSVLLVVCPQPLLASAPAPAAVEPVMTVATPAPTPTPTPTPAPAPAPTPMMQPHILPPVGPCGAEA